MCYVISGSYDELITHSEETYSVCVCTIVCDLETLKMGWPRPDFDCYATGGGKSFTMRLIWIPYLSFCAMKCSDTEIYIYIYIYLYLYIYIHTYVHTYIYIYIHTYIHTYVHTYIRTHTIHAYIHTCIHTYIHTHT